MADKTLLQLYIEHSGKVSDKWSIYLSEYDRLFMDYRNDEIKMLEIGVQNGGSLEIWSKYFMFGTKFIGCDINKDCSRLVFDDDRINVVVGDACADDVKDEILSIASGFDIVIDDGSHFSRDIIISFIKYFPHIKDGGMFVAEDLHCSYWENFGGGLYDPYSSITFFKLLSDVVNAEHWGIDKKPDEIFDGFAQIYKFELPQCLLEEVHSVEFINSICVIRKSPHAKNVLGERVVVGDASIVVEGLRERIHQVPSQRENFWSIRTRPPQEELRFLLDGLESQHRNILALSKDIERLEHKVADKNRQVEEMHTVIRGVEQSLSWRITKPLRSVKRGVKYILDVFSNISDLLSSHGGLLRSIGKAVRMILSLGVVDFVKVVRYNLFRGESSYKKWLLEFDTLDELRLARFREKSAALEYRPLISIVMPVYNTPHEFLQACIDSVIDQVYQNWELCIADDASTDQGVRNILKRYEAKDDRIKVIYCDKNGHISKASNMALTLATGEFIGLLDHDDILRQHALYMVVKALNNNPGYRYIYSDEDKITKKGERVHPHFKPDWNYDLFLSMNYLCHFSVFETGLLREIGGFRLGYEGSQDYDLQLRYTEKLKPEEICHLPYILYHWRIIPGSTSAGPGEKDYCAEAGLHAVTDYLTRNEISGDAELVPGWGTILHVRYHLPENPPLVSIIIPTRNGYSLLKQCIDSIRTRTSYYNYEIVVVDNDSDEDDCVTFLDELRETDGVRVLSYPGVFNYSAINNYAVSEAEGDIICLLNNDIEVINSDWLEELVSNALRPEVGAVGAKLIYEDDTIQHGGVILGLGGAAGHAHRLVHWAAHGYFGRAGVRQNYSAVTGACLAMRRDIYLELGGLDEDRFAVSYNDVDLCLRALKRGFINVWTPLARLYHFESKTRGYDDTPEKAERLRMEENEFRAEWGGVIDSDPAYNPNLSQLRDFEYAFPPRVVPPESY